MDNKLTKEERFEKIYKSCANEVYRVCRHLTADDDLAQEIAQQAFVNFYERIDTLDMEYAKAYIIRSARNLMYNYYRDTKKEQTSTDDEDVQIEEPIGESVEEQYFEEIRRNMVGEFTSEILADLKENHENWYEVINMIFFKDMNHDAVAENLGITKEVLYSRLHRAKMWIRKNYGNEFKKLTDKA